ncbi:UL16-binding protein 2-like isoform X2 [Tamandua tetradactyla]|uniref:UL16-binding protein 2-like isoform X2 n=1 Tax=Tamandua tetradactyla TaxID=48850 RepID=UPI0040539442
MEVGKTMGQDDAGREGKRKACRKERSCLVVWGVTEENGCGMAQGGGTEANKRETGARTKGPFLSRPVPAGCQCTFNSGMARAACIALFFYVLMLLLGWNPEASGGAHSMSCSFTVISRFGPGLPRCEVQGQVDEKPFLYYKCGSNRAEPLGPLGERVNATKIWTEFPQVLEDVEQELRSTLPDIRLEQNKTKGTSPPTLQAQMSCQQEGDQVKGASWQFSVDGQVFLLFDSINTNWTVVHPQAGAIKETWESDRTLANHLRKFSRGDCSYWLQEFLKHWEKMLELTATTPDVKSSQPQAVQLLSWLTLLVCIFLIISVALVAVVCLRGSRPRKPRAEAGVAGRGLGECRSKPPSWPETPSVTGGPRYPMFPVRPGSHVRGGDPRRQPPQPGKRAPLGYLTAVDSPYPFSRSRMGCGNDTQKA